MGVGTYVLRIPLLQRLTFYFTFFFKTLDYVVGVFLYFIDNEVYGLNRVTVRRIRIYSVDIAVFFIIWAYFLNFFRKHW